MVKKQIKKSKEMPMGVKVLSVLAYIGAAFTLLVGLAMILGAKFFSSWLNNLPGYMSIGGEITSIMLIIFGILFLAFAVIDYFIAIGLRGGKNWARILVLVFSALSVVSSLMPLDIVSLIIGGVIIWYLGFDEEAKDYFK